MEYIMNNFKKLTLLAILTASFTLIKPSSRINLQTTMTHGISLLLGARQESPSIQRFSAETKARIRTKIEQLTYARENNVMQSKAAQRIATICRSTPNIDSTQLERAIFLHAQAKNRIELIDTQLDQLRSLLAD